MKKVPLLFSFDSLIVVDCNSIKMKSLAIPEGGCMLSALEKEKFLFEGIKPNEQEQKRQNNNDKKGTQAASLQNKEWLLSYLSFLMMSTSHERNESQIQDHLSLLS